MTALEIQTKMSLVFEELKTIEVKIQSAKANLDKAEKQAATCKEGLQEVNKRLRSIKDEYVIILDQVLAAQKDVETVEKFYDQSRNHASILKATVVIMEKFRKNLQDGYDKLGAELSKADSNVVYLDEQCRT